MSQTWAKTAKATQIGADASAPICADGTKQQHFFELGTASGSVPNSWFCTEQACANQKQRQSTLTLGKLEHMGQFWGKLGANCCANWVQIGLSAPIADIFSQKSLIWRWFEPEIADSLTNCQNRWRVNTSVSPIEVRIGQTWSEFGLFWAKWSEKGPNWPPKVRIRGWKQCANSSWH